MRGIGKCPAISVRGMSAAIVWVVLVVAMHSGLANNTVAPSVTGDTEYK